MKQFVGTFNGQFVVVEKTGRTATNRRSLIGTLVEVRTTWHQRVVFWAPENELFEIEEET